MEASHGKDDRMLSDESRRTALASKQLYDEQLREGLERSDHGKFVCIEPQSGDHFVGNTIDDAVNLAIDAHPDRLTHTLRIGHSAALHLGVMFQ
jgi:hypothetical protein